MVEAASSVPERTLPRALVVGPMKCGTSWIHEYLEGRGDVCLPQAVKETFYFDRYPSRGIDWYSRHFQGHDPSVHRTVVEVAPSLFHASDTAVHKIRAELGDIPVVVTLRDPVARAWSHYQHMSRGYTRLNLEGAIRKYPEIVEASRYSRHLPIWQAAFSQVTVLWQSDLQADPEAYAAALSLALGLVPRETGRHSSRRSNEATIPRFWILAWIGRYSARGLRHLGLYNAVLHLKKLGLKDLFYGTRPATGHKPDATDLALLRQVLAEELPSGSV